MDEEALTYDALRRVERQENTSPRLTKLEPGFWMRLGDHLNKLREAFQGQQEEDPTARRTVVLADELRNTQRLAESIWSLREKKVVQAAMGGVRRREPKALVPEHATKEERDLFMAVMEVMTVARDEAAITDPFSKRRQERVQQEKDAQARSRQSEGGARDDASGLESDREHAKPVASGVHPGAAGVRGGPAAPAVHAAAGGVGVGQGVAKGAGEGRSGGGVQGASGIRGVQGGGEEGGQQGVQEGAAAGAGSGVAATGGKEGGEEAQAVEGRGGVGAPGEQEVEFRLVEALREVPLFAGPDLITYELRAGSVGNLPAKAAQILQERGLVRILPDA